MKTNKSPLVPFWLRVFIIITYPFIWIEQKIRKVLGKQ